MTDQGSVNAAVYNRYSDISGSHLSNSSITYISNSFKFLP
ncbi:unnamed protein product [Brugia pahangi]|uniref:Uncharacterized protein n=2 Tax=Brugia TaxID=6278 RepID=A8QHS3_BRUMA|nr:unnamed protein product [Brugia pahangi]